MYLQHALLYSIHRHNEVQPGDAVPAANISGLFVDKNDRIPTAGSRGGDPAETLKSLNYGSYIAPIR